MVLIHCNIHASQKYPLEFIELKELEEVRIIISNEGEVVTVKRYNTNLYEIFEQETIKCIFNEEFYYTYETEVQNVEDLNLEVEVFSNNECIGKGNITQNQLKQHVYGTSTVQLSHPVTKHIVGSLHFDYLVIPSEAPHEFTFNGKRKYEPIFEDFVYVGHRGSGSTKQRTLPHLENTIASFIEAHKLGASFVELDVQLTKDHVPVVFHDDFVAVLDEKDCPSNIEKIPVKDLTYADICSKRLDFARPDAGLNYDHRFKGLFPTLEELLTQLPSSLGIFMEIKYPEPDQGMVDLIGKDVVVDRVLDVMCHMTINQPIMFCSFDPEICLLLKHKQSSFPVFLITVGENAYTTRNPWAPFDMRSRTRGMAANFAICHDLKGISINSDPLMNSKSDIIALTTYLKEHDKLLFSWGGANDHGEYAALQKSVQMAGVISDKLYNLNIGVQRNI